jgi:hypothetical protein
LEITLRKSRYGGPWFATETNSELVVTDGSRETIVPFVTSAESKIRRAFDRTEKPTIKNMAAKNKPPERIMLEMFGHS